MKKPIKDILDLDEYTIKEELPNIYTTLTITQKKISPYPKFLCKTFNFSCNTSKAQKIVIETFYQISCQKYQYLQSYNRYSFLSFKLDWNPTFSMKYISQTTLDDILKNKSTEKKWKLSDALQCLFAVAEGIGYLHDHLIIHGNLCPSNILVDAANQCYVCDFGLYPIKNLYIRPNEVANKDYRAPEMNVHDLTTKCDVYSYGVLMCHIGLVFLQPKNKETLNEFIKKDDKTKFNFLPYFLTDLIMKCLSTNPLERPSFTDIRDHFQGSRYLLGSTSISALYTEFKKSNYTKNLADLGDVFALNKLGDMYAKGKGFEKDELKAMKCYKKAASKGNSDAQANYGVSLQEHSEQTPENLAKGAEYLKKSAESGNVHGMANYGIALLNGDGVEQNQKESEKFLKAAADLGYKYAQANYGYNLVNSNNPTPEQINEFLKYTKMAIDQGYPDGYYSYGLFLTWGLNGMKKDMNLANEYFKKAADLGDERAMIEYASSNYLADPPNYETALKYYRMAYDQGCKGQEIKQIILELTQKVNEKLAKDEDAAKDTTTTTTTTAYTKNTTPKRKINRNNKQPNNDSSSSSSPSSSSPTSAPASPSKTVINIALPESAKIPDFDKNTPSHQLLAIYKYLEDEYIRLLAMERKLRLSTKDNTHYRIFKYEDRLIQTEDPLILYKYGKLYLKLSDYSRSYKEKALNYIRMAADAENSDAQVKYGVILQKGKDIKKDLVLGLSYLQKAADQDNIKGMYHYGLALFNGEGIKANKEFGLDYLKIAADENYPEAQLMYGLYTSDYEIGHQYVEKAVEANYEKAVVYYANDFMEGRGVKQDYNKAADILRDFYANVKSFEGLITLIKCLKHIGDEDELNHYLKILADQDDVEFINSIHKAQFHYGIKLFYGDGVPKDEEMAINYLLKSTYIGKIRSKFPEIFAKMPHDFSSVEGNIDTFLNRNKNIIDQNELRIIQNAYNGDIDDMLEAAKMINRYGDHRTANFFFELAADSNQTEANYIVGKFYLEGKNGLHVNITKGNNYIKRAAELGHTDAKYELILSQMKLIKNKSIDNNDLFNELYDEICEIAANDYLPAMVLKAKYLIKKDKLDEAKEELGNVLQKSPNDSKILYRVGKLLLQINDEDEFALQLIELSTKSEIKASYFLGKYYFEKRSGSIVNLKNALFYLQKAADNKIKNSQRLFDMCKIEFDRLKRDNPQIDEQIQKSEDQIDVFDPPEVNSFEIMKNLKKDPDSIFSITSIIGLQQMSEQSSTKSDLDDQEQQQDDSFIDLSLPNDELIKKGESFQEMNNYMDAFQCFEAVAIRGEPYGYFKCAEVCIDMEKKLQYYQIAILNNIDGAFSGWRKCILDYVASNKDSISFYAHKFLDQNDFSDAAILFQKVRDFSNVEFCYQKAVQHIQDIKDGMQQYDFGIFLEQRKEIDLAFTMFNKAFENGIAMADKKIKELSKFKRSQLKKLNQTDSFLEQGICYFEGKDGNPVDMNKALSNLTKASDIGCAKADFYLGKYYQRTNDLDQAIFYTKKSANAGDPDGQNSYGDYLRLGICVDEDTSQAIKYYKLSADQGNVLGEYNYGREVLLGSFPDDIKEEGIEFLKKAANKQHPDAMYYYSKAINEIDPDKSDKYFQKAIQEGSEIAIEEHGQDLEDEELYEQAAKLYKSAAEKGLLIGYRKYAEFIINGYTIDSDDLDLARTYLKKVADLGDAKDQFNYAEFLYQNFLDDSIEERAIYFKKSAEKGYPRAFFRYAECLQNGDGVEQNLDEARKYYTQSYKEDPDSPTHYNLKRLKQQGLIDC